MENEQQLEVILDNQDLKIAIPYNYEAFKSLSPSIFTEDQFIKRFFDDNETYYIVSIKSKELLFDLRNKFDSRINNEFCLVVGKDNDIYQGINDNLIELDNYKEISEFLLTKYEGEFKDLEE